MSRRQLTFAGMCLAPVPHRDWTIVMVLLAIVAALLATTDGL